MRMWELSNFTPFPAVAGFERDAAGNSHYVVSIASSFRVDASGRLIFEGPQTPPAQAPEFDQADPEKLMLQDAEHAMSYPGVDVALYADSALAHGEDRRRVSLRVGELLREAVLLQPMQRDRRGLAEAAVSASDTVPAPLDWRSSWGGTIEPSAVAEGDRTLPENPLGLGADVKPGGLLPRLVRADQAFGPGDIVQDLTPISFSALPSSWPQRVALAGTFDAGWQRNKAPLLPDDYDPRFGQSVQPEQVHPGPLIGGEMVELTGMQTPAGDQPWRFHLPALRFGLELFYKDAWQSQPASLQRISIDARQGRLRMIWRGGLTLARMGDDVRLRETQIHLKAAQGFSVPATNAPEYHSFAQDHTQLAQTEVGKA